MTKRAKRAFARRTKVPVERTRGAIEQILVRYGAGRFAYLTETNRAVIMFEAQDRRMRFELPLPVGDSTSDEKARRAKWRALLLCIKAKLESVESQIETFEEAFLAHVVLPDERTVGDHIMPRIAEVYVSGTVQALLPGPESIK